LLHIQHNTKLMKASELDALYKDVSIYYGYAVAIAQRLGVTPTYIRDVLAGRKPGWQKSASCQRVIEAAENYRKEMRKQVMQQKD